MKKVAVGAIGLVVAAVAAYVVVGMIGGIDPQFSRGRSPTSLVFRQEILGALTLVTLGTAATRLIAVARGRHPGRLLILLPVGLVLAVVWWFALAVERAS